MISFCNCLPLIYCKFFFLEQNCWLTMGSCRYSLIFLCPTFSSAILPTHSALLANGSHGGFTSDSCICCKTSKHDFLCLDASPAGPGNGSTYWMGVNVGSLPMVAHQAWSLKVCCSSSGKLSALGKSSKPGSGEYMCLHLGDELSFFLIIFLCHSFRQI